MTIREYLKRAWRRTYHRRTVTRAAVATASAMTILVSGVLWASDANADPLPKVSEVSGCQSQTWIIWGANTRTICDGFVHADGSWVRWREFWTPAHNVPLTCNTYGSRGYSSTSCTGGYWQERTTKGVEKYLVTPDTLLPDEPDHLVGSTYV